jgi:hypothetical protein
MQTYSLPLILHVPGKFEAVEKFISPKVIEP